MPTSTAWRTSQPFFVLNACSPGRWSWATLPPKGGTPFNGVRIIHCVGEMKLLLRCQLLTSNAVDNLTRCFLQGSFNCNFDQEDHRADLAVEASYPMVAVLANVLTHCILSPSRRTFDVFSVKSMMFMRCRAQRAQIRASSVACTFLKRSSLGRQRPPMAAGAQPHYLLSDSPYWASIVFNTKSQVGKSRALL